MSTRRTFIRLMPIAGAGLFAASARAQPILEEKDATAVALAYHADAAKIDRSKQPKYVPGSLCSNCQLYQGKPGASAGPCPIFTGKQVMAKGWCNAYSKKA